MQNRMRVSAMGGYVMSPFGDFDVGSLINGVLNVGGKIADAVNRGNTATPYTTQTANPYQTNSYQTNTQQGWGSAPPVVTGMQDNTMLYIIGGAAALMVAGLILTRR